MSQTSPRNDFQPPPLRPASPIASSSYRPGDRASISPALSRRRLSMATDRHSENGDKVTSPPRPTPSSRMALSALVNSPQQRSQDMPTRSPSANPASTAAMAYNPTVSSSSSQSAYAYPHNLPQHPPGHRVTPRYDSPPEEQFHPDAPSTYPPRYANGHGGERGHGQEVDRAYAERYSGSHDPRYVPIEARQHPSYASDNYGRHHTPHHSHSHIATARSERSTSRTNGNHYDDPDHVRHRRDSRNRSEDVRGSVGPRGGMVRDMVPGPSLIGGEDVWEDSLRDYQQRRETEANEISLLAARMYEASSSQAQLKKSSKSLRGASPMEGSSINGEVESEAKPPTKRKGWPADHPTRIAQREAKEAAIASGQFVPKRQLAPKKGSKGKTNVAALEDELLGLAEGESATASLAPRSSMEPRDLSSMMGSDDEDGPAQEPSGNGSNSGKPPRRRRPPKQQTVAELSPDDIIQPCGLTRAELTARYRAGDLQGLTPDDIKAVHDEDWIRKKGEAGELPVRKDGTMRKKPGPAKGFKLKKQPGEVYAQPSERRAARLQDGSELGENGSMAGDETMNGEAEAEIAALLPEAEGSTPNGAAKKPKAKSKKRKAPPAETSTLGEDEIVRLAELDDTDNESRADVTVDDLTASLIDDGPVVAPAPKKKKKKGTGLGRWPKGPAALRAAAALQAANSEEIDIQNPGTPSYEGIGQEISAAMAYVPNTEDPRGVSEAEAKVRLQIVDDLQKSVWSSICKDVPRVYRVYQAYDTAAKADAIRKAEACQRNAFFQRAAKPTYKSIARVKKDSAVKAKKVVKEMLVYWRKNEKEELAARKKAEKEALDRAKAEEEARESKRQARKLNFLLTQTELYSHFIGKKIKTKEAEGEDGDAAAPSNGDQKAANEDLALDANGEPLPDIDYDDDDEENLRRHAARGAQAAVQAAKDKAKAFDNARAGKDAPLDLDGDELNFQNPTLAEDSVTIEQPKMLMAQLKEYQLKGLTWLGNLYEQGINGILADEMGLGKTIQSISLLAYLAEHHNLWGPFLVIAPASTLHNWQQELARFVPRLKALPYWGSTKDRETLRKIWSRKNMTFDESSPFHILVTSYQLAVQDEKYFQHMKWQYMILDEAQAIKSSSSARWKTLLSLHCRNRLLLTGTPIQNSMQELWALLHFIMPSLFDSHEEFSEWFSKDIENAAGGNSGSLQPEQLRRLHMILKPFMLRRVKKHVQKELGDKIEIDLLVDLSQRQRNIYKALRQRVSISDLMAEAGNLSDTSQAKNLMNLVMQFRKVCNHPDLFERADVISPFMFGTFSHSGPLSRQGDQLYCPDSAKNAIQVDLPKALWTEGGKLDVPGEMNLAGSDTKVLGSLMNIWRADWINDSLKKDDGEFGFLKVLDVTAGEAERRAKTHPLVSLLDDAQGEQVRLKEGSNQSDRDFAAGTAKRFDIVPPRVADLKLSADLPALRDITNQAWTASYLSRGDSRFATESVVAPFVKPFINNRSYHNRQSRLGSDPLVERAMYGTTPSERNDPLAVRQLSDLVPGIGPRGLLGASPIDQVPISSMRVPPTKRLIVDSAKLARLDDLLRELKAGGHRVLLYFQMTKMMDLVEEYLIYRQFKYLRLDGSSPIGERRDMVTSWQTNPEIFIFCLSTRAGGLGINLTAADTVVFYDHDWNPSNDAQAMDRAHRVGQTKQVTVYRLIARGTIEERIVKLARAKKDVQDIVVGTKSLTDVAKPSEIVSLFMDDEELAESVAKRKQAEEHGYVAPALVNTRTKSKFGDGLTIPNDDDEDDFFSLTKKPANGEDEDFGDEAAGGSGTKTPKEGAPKKKSSAKRKAQDGEETGAKKQKTAKKVKIALGPDGLPI